MGREIRKVAKGWQHPKKEDGHYKPLYDKYFEDAFIEWEEGRQKWIKGEDPDADKYNNPKTTKGYIEWNGGSPDPEYYRDVKWTEQEACCFQYYQNVSEGTPLSPVFDTLKELEDWLVSDQGHSRTAAQNFCKSGSAPSMVMHNCWPNKK